VSIDVEQHLSAFRRGAVDLIDERELAKRLKAGNPLRLKYSLIPLLPDRFIDGMVKKRVWEE
jgi:hypothetical protein